MGELASGVAHEIRNPINAIGMIAQRFRKEFTPQRDQEEFESMAESVVGETRRINEIIRRFLQFAKPPALQPSPVEMAEFLEEISGVFKSSAEAKGVTFKLKQKDGQRLSVDKDQLTQAILNLLQNAFDATSAGSAIALSGRRVPPDYLITIADQGSGIAGENLKKIFDLYYTTKEDGTGMGLPIVAQIVQSHGGSIDVESSAGVGTIFRIRLPLEDIA
jgi:signal transduction histidine kinase